MRTLLLYLTGCVTAAVAQPQVIPLWDHDAPGAVGTTEADRPTITVYRPTSPGARIAARQSGLAVIVAPGGGYSGLASTYEGSEEAYWLNSLGVTAFVLKYRLAPRYRFPAPLQDAQRALRLVRSRAASYNIRSDRIGMMGFSAGGHLTAMAGTHFDAGDANATDVVERVSSRPDFLVLAYALVTFTAPVKHEGIIKLLLGENPDSRKLDDLSPELHVTTQTPPAFLFATTDDAVVQVEHSLLFYRALIQHGVPAEMHLFASGPHGAGMGMHDLSLGEWPTLLANWMRGRGWLTYGVR